MTLIQSRFRSYMSQDFSIARDRHLAAQSKKGSSQLWELRAPWAYGFPHSGIQVLRQRHQGLSSSMICRLCFCFPLLWLYSEAQSEVPRGEEKEEEEGEGEGGRRNRRWRRSDFTTFHFRHCALPVLSHLIFTMIIRGRKYCCQLTHEETEAQEE